ncbi:hypothetical protein PT931_34305 [Longispora urticae]
MPQPAQTGSAVPRPASTGSAVPRPRVAPEHVTPLAEIPVALRGASARPADRPRPGRTRTAPVGAARTTSSAPDQLARTAPTAARVAPSAGPAAPGHTPQAPAAPGHAPAAADTVLAERETPAPRSLTHSGARGTAHPAPTLAGRRVRADGVRRGPTGDPR